MGCVATRVYPAGHPKTGWNRPGSHAQSFMMDISTKWVIASCSTTFGRYAKEPITRLVEAGCVVKMNPYQRQLSRRELAALAADADVLVVGNTVIDGPLLKHMPNLKLIVRNGVGVENIDLVEAGKRGITVANVPGGNRDETADLVFGLIIGLERQLYTNVYGVKHDTWRKFPGHTLSGQTLGIVGVGSIGMAVARRAEGFGMKVLGYDIAERELATLYGLEFTTLNDLLKRSDVVSLHVPLTDATANMIGSKELRMIGPKGYLINTARAGIVREASLEKALLSGGLGGYATDVYEREPPRHSPIFDLQNVLVTPHIGSSTFEANLRMGDIVADNILAAMAGDLPPNIVDSRSLANSLLR